MVTRQEIQTTCDDIVREFAPLQVFLFGSYAYGIPTESSDVDLLVVMDIPKSEFHTKAVEIQQHIPRRFSMDLLVRSPKEIAYRLSYNDWFLREITEKGELLHGSNTHCSIKNLHDTHDGVNVIKMEKDGMNPLTLEWIQRGEADYVAVQQLLRTADPLLHNIICFHAQQCIEKYLKAWLQQANIPIPRTHNLEELDLIVHTLPDWSDWQPEFRIITKYAVEPRYPGDLRTAENTQHANRICEEVRQAVRTHLKLPMPVHE